MFYINLFNVHFDLNSIKSVGWPTVQWRHLFGRTQLQMSKAQQPATTKYPIRYANSSHHNFSWGGDASQNKILIYDPKEKRAKRERDAGKF